MREDCTDIIKVQWRVPASGRAQNAKKSLGCINSLSPFNRLKKQSSLSSSWTPLDGGIQKAIAYQDARCPGKHVNVALEFKHLPDGLKEEFSE